MRLPVRSPTVADALFPAWQKDTLLARLAYDAVLILGFTGLVILSAQIAIRLPWTTVPITGSTFGVLVAGGALGAWRGAGSLTLYMLLGIMGAPVFAPGGAATTGSWDVHFIGPWSGSSGLPWDLSSGGYIVGFIFAAALVGYLSERQWDRKAWIHGGMFLGNVILYIPGILWLAYLIHTDWIHPLAGQPLGELISGSGTWDKALKGGLYPFIVGDMMKLFLASLTLPAFWAIANRRDRRPKQEADRWK